MVSTMVEGLQIEDVSGGFVLVKLTSVEHVDEQNDEVDNNFDLEVTITDGGRNKKGKYTADNVKINAGSKFVPNEVIFTGEYDSKNVGEITFRFRAETDTLSEGFVGVTTGDDELKPGTQQFYAPVVLESGRRKSTLIFRGRIDLS